MGGQSSRVERGDWHVAHRVGRRLNASRALSRSTSRGASHPSHGIGRGMLMLRRLKLSLRRPPLSAGW